jgi:hypothetical protein
LPDFRNLGSGKKSRGSQDVQLFSAFVDRAPKINLLPIDLKKHFIEVPG